MLGSTLQKLYAKMLWARVADKVATNSGGQVGCRPQAQGAEAVAACRGLMGKAKEWRDDLVGLKLDVSQAFDRVYRHALLDVLRPAYHDFPHEVLAIAEALQRSDVHFSVARFFCRVAWRVGLSKVVC